MSLYESADKLSARLPELEWTLESNNTPIHQSLLPRGLFNSRLEMTPRLCVDEIKADLLVLKRQANDKASYYLASRISQKINVLVRLCHLRAKKNTPIKPVHFGLQAISTRRQWLQGVEEDIARLVEQQKAVASSLENRGFGTETQVILSLQALLGDIECRLTLAKEVLSRAVGCY